MSTTGIRLKGVECPECGSIFTNAYRAGYSPEGHRIRTRACKTCDHRFTTVEVAAEFIFERVDTLSHERAVKRSQSRPRKFRLGPKPQYRSNDELIVKVTVKPGAKNLWCRKRLHRMVGKNLLVNERGHRRCRQCIRDYNRERSRLERIVDPDGVRARQRAWEAKNRDKIKQQRAARKLKGLLTSDISRRTTG